MSKRFEKKDIIFILAVLTLVIGGLWIYSGRNFINTIYSYDGSVVAVNEKTTLKPEVSRNVEGLLNDMLKRIYGQMQDYRQQRKILDELIKPANLRSPSYVEGNYKLANEVIPELKKQMNQLIKVFDAKDRDIRNVVSGQPEAKRKRILAQWEKMKREQGGAFVQYFTLEDQILDQYKTLMQFYYQQRRSFQYDVANDVIIFTNLSDKGRERQMLQTIQALETQQSRALK